MSRNPVGEFFSAEKRVFRPSDDMKRYKASILARISRSPFLVLKTMTKADFLEQCYSGNLDDWFSQDGFETWLRNEEEHRERLEYLFTLALDSIEELVLSTNEKTQGARIKAIELLTRLADKMPRQDRPNDAMTAIASMDKVQLEAYMEKSGYQVRISGQKDKTEQVSAIDVEDITHGKD